MKQDNIELIYQDVAHAEKLFEILSNEKFIYISVKPKNLQEEIDFLNSTYKKRAENKEHHFTVVLD
jgi:hypothetical protein